MLHALGMMKPMRTLARLGGCLAALLAVSLNAQIKEQAVEYTSGGVTCEGWHAYDGSKQGKRPAVLIVHQWKGVSDYEKERARMLAEMGYNVLVADIYGKGIRPQPPESGKEAGKYKENRALFRERLKSALETLSKDERTDANRIAAIGYCFGGTGALELARSGEAVRGVVSFHGGLGSPTPQDARNIKGRVLICHGADDPYVKPAEVEGFHSEMKTAGVKYEFISYPGAVHSFTEKAAGNDNSKGAAYNADADRQSWEATKKFLSEIFL